MKKEYRDEYKKIVQNACNKSDQKYYLEKAFIVGKLQDGTLFVINKPTLQTKFCYDDSYDFKGALNQAAHARTSREHFKEMNLRQLKGMLANFHNTSQHEKAIRQPHGISRKVTTILVRHDRWGDFSNDVLLSDQDKQTIIEAYKAAIQKQEKRIERYLKRYGLDHVRAWTYWGER